MEIIIFIVKLLGIVALFTGYFFFMGWWMSKLEERQFNEIFKDSTEKEKQNAKTLMRAIEKSHK